VSETAGRGNGRPEARIVSASIELGRNDPRLVGSALHELAHALGYQGHPRRGDSILLRDARKLLETSVRVGKGGAFRDATVSALYAVPSGTVLARVPLAPGSTRSVDRLAAAALREGWVGPFLQVGDSEGRVSWLNARGRRVTLALSGLRAALENPSRLSIEPTPSATRWLEQRANEANEEATEGKP
jgi:hypothetical protein